jgi:tetratricopeptide (TPR) repeat protein
LKQVEKPQALSDKQQIERVFLAAQLLDKKGDPETAVRYLLELIKTWKGLPEMVADCYLFLGQLENKIAKSDDAIKSFERVDELMTDSEKVQPSTHAKAIEALGNIYFDKGDKEKALGYYQKLLGKYENAKPLASIRYKVGKIYFERGEIQKAADIWKELRTAENDKTGFWYKLAQEQLKNSEWQSDYKKYIRRIPAMERQKK